MSGFAGRQVPFITAALVLLLMAGCREETETVPSRRSLEVADHAVATYADAALATLTELVRFRTVKEEGLENVDNPEFHRLTEYLEAKALELELDFTDYGPVVVIGRDESSSSCPTPRSPTGIPFVPSSSATKSRI